MPYITSLQSEDGGSIDLWNVAILPQHYTASQPTRPRLCPTKFNANHL